jgi:hypothetical protein
MSFIKLDEYEQKARLYPAILTLPPFLLLNYYYLQFLFGDFIFATLGIIFGEVSLATILMYFLMEINRFISKMLLEKTRFNNELIMPTTDFLLHKDTTYSHEHKNKIREKMSQEFQICWLSRTEENRNEFSARQQIVERVSRIRAKMKDGRLILKHNIHYGFARNLIGGSYVALLMSTIAFGLFMMVAPNQIAALISFIFVLSYGTLIVLRNFILSELGKNYARVLFQEYLAN